MSNLSIKKIGVLTFLFFASIAQSAEEEKTGFMSNIKQLKEISDVMDIIQENFVGDKNLIKLFLCKEH